MSSFFLWKTDFFFAGRKKSKSLSREKLHPSTQFCNFCISSVAIRQISSVNFPEFAPHPPRRFLFIAFLSLLQFNFLSWHFCLVHHQRALSIKDLAKVLHGAVLDMYLLFIYQRRDTHSSCTKGSCEGFRSSACPKLASVNPEGTGTVE